MPKKILVMGLPGSGKTTVAKKLKKILNADWINADAVRKKYNDWDFSKRGVLRQAKRMRDIAEKSKQLEINTYYEKKFSHQINILKNSVIIFLFILLVKIYLINPLLKIVILVLS